MQTVFRNPLAGPYVLGISSGAGLGVALVVMGFAGLFQFSVFSADNNWILVIASWLGSAAVLIFILAVSFRIKRCNDNFGIGNNDRQCHFGYH
jgi:iron complex transport system permease protein